jgi:ubiquinone/menaquinone biosynthesis C-methylase UbiE
MADASASIAIDRHLVIYAGRFVDQIAGADLPGDCIVLGEQDALPHKLAGVLDRANTLVLLDLPSFPLEAMTDDHWDVPMVVVLPSGSDADSLTSSFGSVLFERLVFFDRIMAPDSELWEELRRKYRLAESQRVRATSEDPGEMARAVCTLLATEPSSTPNADDTARDPRFNKALHRAQAAALEPRFAIGRGDRAARAPLDVLEVGAGAGRWTSSFDPTNTRFVGIDAREDLVGAARANFPDQRFELLGSDLRFPYEDESFDLVFSVTMMHNNPAPAKRTLLSEMWRVIRPGGRLLFLDTFVFPTEPVIYPMSVTEFVDLILDATAGQVVLEHVESLRYPGEEMRRGGVISLLRLGVPTT